MTDRYHVIIIGEFSMEDYNKQGKNEYDLYALAMDPEGELPSQVWFEEWYVEEGDPWDSHPSYNHHELVDEDCFLIDWDEIEKPWMIKDDKWWTEKINTMSAVYDMMKSVYPVANEIIDKVVEIMDPDREGLNEAMQGQIYWPDYYTLGHYIHEVRDSTGIKEEDTNDE